MPWHNTKPRDQSLRERSTNPIGTFSTLDTFAISKSLVNRSVVEKILLNVEYITSAIVLDDNGYGEVSTNFVRLDEMHPKCSVAPLSSASSSLAPYKNTFNITGEELPLTTHHGNFIHIHH